MEENKEGEFRYSYAAPTEEERAEAESIREMYRPRTELERKLERLRLLDKKVKRPAAIVAALLGVCGVLVFGTGLTMILEWAKYAWGCVVAAAGIAVMAAAPFVHRGMFRRAKRKYEKEIVALSEDILRK